MTNDTRAWNEPIDVKVTHEHLNRAMIAFDRNEFSFEDILMAGKAIAILDTFAERRKGTGDEECYDSTGGAEAAVGGYLRYWAIRKYDLIDPEVEKWKVASEERLKERKAHSAKQSVIYEAKKKAKFEAAVAKRIAELGHSAQIAAE